MNIEARCKDIEAAFGKVEISMTDPAILGDPAKYREAARMHRSLGRVVEKWRAYQQARKTMEDAQALVGDTDSDLAEMAREEMREAAAQLPALERDILLMLLPSDPRDEKNIIMEIRAGTGGEEAGLFAGDLFRMYARYAEKKGWKLEILSSNETDLGGFKEVVFGMAGERVYSRMKFESGTHRVQRVPETEAQGRIHTSAITVAVMPEADEVDISIREEDLKVDVYRSGGHGGQSVNTTDSAVRITHLPTGIVVTCQDERSQLKNKIKAMKVLRSRIYERETERRDSEETSARRQQVGSGDRSERIRTYNFPQNRLTDHRIGLTLYKLDLIMQGDLDEVIDGLIQDEERKKLERLG